MSRTLAATIGGAAGGLALVVVLIGFLWQFFCQCKSSRNRNSDTGSSDPSTFGGNGGVRLSLSGGGPSSGNKGVRQFTLEELEAATKNFSESNLVGAGSFGLAYKGLLLDGTVVAIKRRHGSPRQEFVEEVKCLSTMWHRNLVTLIGYCQENSLQILVFEYLPNGSISSHLYDNKKDSITKLEFKQRLSVAIGAAKGLSYLHSLTPPLVHNGFKTSNVLVDENFIAKVADAGIVNLLRRIEGVSPLQSNVGESFQDPEVGKFGRESEASDVYSFGVFLLELITGQEAASHGFSVSRQSLVLSVESYQSLNELIDQRLGVNFTSEGIKRFIELTLRCLNPSKRERPTMAIVVKELDSILETEMTLTTVMGDGTAIVTLGSQLFSS